MLLPIISAILGTLAFSSTINLSFLGLFFLIPLFIFFLKEEKLKKLIWGTFLFRFLWGTGVAYYIWDPIVFSLLSLWFLGLPLSIYFIKKFLKIKKISNQFLFVALPFLWVFWEYLQARYNFISSFIVTSGNIFGNSPFLGLSAWGGILFLIIFAALSNTLGTNVITNINKVNKIKNTLFVSFVLVLIILGGWQISKFELQKNFQQYNAKKGIISIAVISNNKNFDLELTENQLPYYKEVTPAKQINNFLIPIKREILSQNKKIDLVVGPEHFIDLTGLDETLQADTGAILIEVYKNFAKDLNSNFVVTFANHQLGKRYNSAMLFNRRGEIVDIYNKRQLMLAGEVFPKVNGEPRFERGKENKVLKVENFVFGPALCSEIHYPADMKKLKKLGAQFIYNSSSNRWLLTQLFGGLKGLEKYLELTRNLRRIEAVWLKIPIIVSGRLDYPGIILPDGTVNIIDYESESKNYGIFFGEIKI